MKSFRSLFQVLMALLLVFGTIGTLPAKPVQADLPADLFMSEYIEGSSFNKAIEIYNGTGLPVNLSDYRLELYSNGVSTPSQTIVLSGTLATGDVFVAAHPSANLLILAQADLTSSTVVNFNGDDAFALRKISTGLFADVIGQIGFDPGSYWGSDPVRTENRTLVRKVDICAGDTDGSNVFDPVTEWDAYAIDTFAYIGSHTSSCAPTSIGLTAIADAYTTDKDTELVVTAAAGLLSNDIDGYIGRLIALLDVTAANGELVLAADGSFTYMPGFGFIGEDSFTYKAFDFFEESSVTTVTITVTEKVPPFVNLYMPVIVR